LENFKGLAMKEADVEDFNEPAFWLEVEKIHERRGGPF